jgi:O-antigen/teichoic acid export membrane protein
MRAAAVLLPLLALINLRSRVFRGFESVRGSIVADKILAPLLVILAALILDLTTVVDLYWIYCAALAATFLIASVWLWRLTAPVLAGAVVRFDTRHWVSVALPMIAVNLSYFVFHHVSILMLGAMTTPEEVGLYSAAMRFATANQFTLVAINVVLPPMIAVAFHSDRIKEAWHLFCTATLWSALAALPVFLILALFPEFVLGLYGDEFRAASPVLRVLNVGQLLHAATGPAGLALLMIGKERFVAKVLIAAAIANATANAVAIPLGGAMAVAIVTSVTMVGLKLVLIYAVTRRLRR